MTAAGQNEAARRLRIILSGIVLFSLLGLALLWTKGPEVAELRVGVLAPLTNSSVRMGVTVRALGDLEKRINGAGGLELGGRRYTLRLIVRDTANRVESAMSEASLLVRQERVSALIGPYFSRTALPVSQVAEAAHVPMLTPTASAPELTQGRSYVFRSCLTNAAQAHAMADFALDDLRQRRAGIIFDEADPYSSGLAAEFRKAFVGRGGEVLTSPYATGQADFSSQVHSALKNRAEVLYLPNFPEDVTRQMRQARAAGFRGVFLGADGWDSDRRFLALPEAQGAFFSAEFAPDGLSKTGQAEAERYEQILGEPLDKEAALTLDAMGILLEAVRKAGSVEPGAIRDALASVKDFEGITGRISFAGGGDAVREVHILDIAGGKSRLRQISPSRTQR